MTSEPYVILSHPQLAENVGMVARAMAGCGLTRLRLVAPHCDPRSPGALSAATHGAMILEKAEVFKTLSESLVDLHYVVATTARQREMNLPILPFDSAFDPIIQHLGKGEGVAILFGNERVGLSNEEISLCQQVLCIPAISDHASFNLSQAVLLVVHTLFVKRHVLGTFDYPSGRNRRLPTGSQLATGGAVGYLVDCLFNLLAQTAYFQESRKAPLMRRNLRILFAKAGLSVQEVQSLEGVFSALFRAAPQPLPKRPQKQ